MTNEIKKYKVNINNFLEKHKKIIMLLFLIILFCYYLIWTVSQPYDSCPDEYMKWDICKYMFENNKLPRGDDPSIRNPIWGISYAFQPIFTYMISTIFMKIASIFTMKQFSLVVAARLVSTISMTIAIYFVIKIADKLFKNQTIYKMLFVGLIAFQPITAFLASYINNDSTALLATAMIIYTWILGMESNWKIKHCIILGLEVGFCALTYYNAYSYILCSILICITSAIVNKMKFKEIMQKGVIVAIIAFSIAGWWFIRNAVIYNGDFLGLETQVQIGDKYAQDEYKPSTRLTPQRKNESIMYMLVKDEWIKTTLKSFVGIFGYQSIMMSNKIYTTYLFIWIIGGIGVLLKSKEMFKYDSKEKNKYLLNYIFIVSIIIPILLSIYYSYASDFQPQGRYIMIIIIPFTYFLVNGIQKILEKTIKSSKIRNLIVILLILLIVAISARALFGYIIPIYR